MANRIPHTVLPVILPATPYGKVALGERVPVVPKFTPEAAADCHAQFGDDLWSLIDQKGGGCFAPVAIDGSPGTPIFTANSVITADSVFTCSIAAGVMTVAGSVSGQRLAVGDVIDGASVTAGTTIASLGTGTGGAGTYNLSNNITSAANTRYATKGRRGLIVPWDDLTEQTTVTVFRMPPLVSNMVIMGDYSTLDTAAGWYARIATNQPNQYVRPSAPAVAIPFPARSEGSYLCMVQTEDAAGVYVQVCGQAVSTAGPRVASGRRRSIGNIWLQLATYQTPIEVCEVLRIPAKVSDEERLNLYTRAKARGLARGYSIP